MTANPTSSTASKFALIGAGPMGLAMAISLNEHGISFQGFELNTGVGGLWDIEAPRSTMYETAHLISSKTMTEFTAFPMNEDVAEYPSHREMRKYFNDFADHFDLKSSYRFQTEVVSAQPADDEHGGWIVRWKAQNGSSGQERFRGLLVANGTLSEPNRPSFDGSFDGELIHACDYRHPEIFAGKRVLIVGAGNSGCDIAVDAITHGVTTDISMRRGYHFVPKYIFGKPADTVGGALKLPKFIKSRIEPMILKWFTGNPQKYGFPEPDHALFESHPIVNSLVLFYAGHGDIHVKPDIARLDGQTVHFSDGSSADYDIIVAATGYLLHYPFLDRSLLNWKDDAPHLYLNCFHPERDDLFLLGMVEAKGLGWQGRQEQADLVAHFIKASDRNSPAAEAFRQTKAEPFPDMSGGMNYIKLARMAYYVDKDTYRQTIGRHIRAFEREAAT